MNRYAFLGAQTDEKGVEWCYILDTQTGTTHKSPVKAFGAAPEERRVETTTTERGPVFPIDTVAAPGAVKKEAGAGKPDPVGELETAEQRTFRLAHPKVPAAFSPRMHMDPGKTGGVTDVTQPH